MRALQNKLLKNSGCFLLNVFALNGIFIGQIFGAEIKVTSSISNVAVYLNSAVVTREARFDLPAGDHTLIFSDLPATIDENSLQVEGKTSNASTVQIGAVASKKIYLEQLVSKQEKELEAQLFMLHDEIRQIDDRTRAATDRLAFIKLLGNQAANSANRSIELGKIEVLSWEKAWQTIDKGAQSVYDDIRRGDNSKRERHNKVKKLEQELQQIRTNKRESIEVRIKVNSNENTPATIKLTYQVVDVMWVPFYNVRLSTEKSEVIIEQWGEIKQKTGENWQQVDLLLSNAPVTHAVTAPHLTPWFIDVQPPSNMREHKAIERSLAAPSDVQEGDLMIESAASAPVTTQNAGTLVTGFAAIFDITGSYDIPADNQPHRVPLAKYRYKAEPSIRAIPKINPVAYLYSNVTYGGEIALLPGAAAIFRDNDFIGKSELPLTRPGEKIDIYFGADDQIRIEYLVDKNFRQQEGIFNRQKRIDRGYLINVANFHRRNIEITVMDQLPISQDERIIVKLSEDADRPSEPHSSDEKGVLRWTKTYGPVESGVIRFSYSVTYPTGIEVQPF